MAGQKLFDSYDEDENEYEQEDSEEGPTHLAQIRQILEEAKIDIEEEDGDRNFDTFFVLSTGVFLGFDEEGKLIAVKKNE